LESQRVKILKEGYLRGWLTFEYPNLGSYLRERIILDYIEEQHVLDLLQNRLMIETVLRSTLTSKSKDVLEPIFDTSKTIMELKLPSVFPKDKIKDNDKSKLADITQDPEALKKEIDEWKALFNQVEQQKT
jgi:hypothetical protein